MLSHKMSGNLGFEALFCRFHNSINGIAMFPYCDKLAAVSFYFALLFPTFGTRLYYILKVKSIVEYYGSLLSLTAT